MKLAFTFMFAVLSHAATACAAEEVAQQVNPSGTWRWEYEMQGETIKDAMKLNLGKEGKVTGTFHSRGKTIEITEAKIDGKTLTVAVPVDFQGTEVGLNFSGQIKEDDIEGTVDVDFNGQTSQYPWKPKRSVELDDVTGTWNIHIETADGNEFEPTLKIAKKDDQFTSTYTSMQGFELDVKDLRVEKNQLMFTVTAEFDGNSLKVDYAGRPYGDTIRGRIEYEFSGTTGEGEFVAKRKSEKKKKKKK